MILVSTLLQSLLERFVALFHVFFDALASQLISPGKEHHSVIPHISEEAHVFLHSLAVSFAESVHWDDQQEGLRSGKISCLTSTALAKPTLLQPGVSVMARLTLSTQPSFYTLFTHFRQPQHSTLFLQRLYFPAFLLPNSTSVSVKTL